MNVLGIVSLPIALVSGKGVRRFNRLWAASWWALCVGMGRLFYGVEVVATGDPIPPRENAVLLLNHQEMTDVVFVPNVAMAAGRVGDLKWFVKDPVKHVPGLGWGMRFLDNFFVKRDWSKDRPSIEATFGRLKKYQVPYWILIFAEGTRITEEKLERSRRIMRRKGTRVTDRVMLPHSRGFAATVTGLADTLDAVYDVTVGYPDGIPTLSQFVLGYAPKAHFHVRRYPVERLPGDPRELGGWLEERFEEKDRLLEEFEREGEFPAGARRL